MDGDIKMSVFSGDKELDEKINLWLRWDCNEKTLFEIEELINENKWPQLRKRLMERLSFGTAGLRGVMGAGFNAMNDLVVIQTAQGLCDYIIQKFPNESDQQRGVVFGYDGRYNSKRFAELSTCIFLQRGIKVLLFSEMVPTPFVPFTISEKGCLAGVMVTASHNPKEDNGYKVYWSNGTQIITPHDKGIQKAIMANLEPRKSSWNTDVLQYHDLLEDPFEDIFSLYYQKLTDNFLHLYVKHNENSNLRFVYSAMHGVGYPFVKQAFKQANLPALLAVEEQMLPDPEFRTVKFPNPEEGKSSLELSFRKADAENVSIILANDPDADRLACAEKDETTGKWKVFNGNELGALLGWWCVKTFKELQTEIPLSDCYLLASTVSSKILRAICKREGLHFEETLTGFKWLGNRAIELMSAGKQVIFAFEEAIGFMVSTTVLDKDGVSAAIHLATMATYLQKTQGITLLQKLNDIYDNYGYHCNLCSYLFCYDTQVMKRIFERLRNYNTSSNYPDNILNGEFKIIGVRDLTTGVDTNQADGKAKLPTSSSSQMLTFSFDNGLVLTLRSSGTEPKLKYYAELCASPDEKDYEQLRQTLTRMVTAAVEEFLQPKLNNLVYKAD